MPQKRHVRAQEHHTAKRVQSAAAATDRVRSVHLRLHVPVAVDVEVTKQKQKVRDFKFELNRTLFWYVTFLEYHF